MIKARKIAAGCLTIALILVGIAILARQPLLNLALRQLVLPEIERRSQLRLSVGRLDSAALNRLTLHELRLVDPGASGERRMRIDLDMLDLRVRWPALRHGIQAFLEDSRITLHAPRGELWLGEGGADQSKTGSGRVALPLDLKLPEIVVRNASLLVTQGERRLAIDGLSAALERRAETTEGRALRVAAALMRMEDNGRQWAGPLQMKVSLDPTGIDLSALHWGDLLRLDAIRVEPTRSQGLSFRGQAELLDVSITLAGTLTGSRLVLETTALAADKARLTTLLLDQTGLSLGRCKTEGKAEIDLEVPAKSTAKLRLAGSGGVIDALALDEYDLGLRLEQGICFLDPSRLNAGGNHLLVDQASLPLPALLAADPEAMFRAAGAKVHLTLGNLVPLLALAGREAVLPPHRITLSASLAQGLISSEEGMAMMGESRLDLRELRIKPPPCLTAWREAEVSLKADLLVPDAKQLAAAFGRSDIQGSLRANLDLAGTAEAPQGEMTVSGDGLALDALDGLALGALHARVLLEPSGLASGSLEITPRDGEFLRAFFGYDLGRDQIERLKAEVKMEDFGPYLLTLAGVENLTGRITAELSASGPRASPVVTLDARADGLQSKGFAMDLVELKASLQGHDLAVSRLAVHGPGLRGELAADLAFAPGEIAARLHALRLDHEGLDLNLAQPAKLRLTTDNLFVDEALVLEGRAGTLRFDGRVGQADNDASLRVSDLNGQGWLEGLVGRDIRLNGAALELRLRGSLAEPRLRLDATVGELAAPGSSLRLAGKVAAEYGPGGLRLRNCFFTDQATGSGLRLDASLPLDLRHGLKLTPGALAVQASLDLPDTELLAALVPGYVRPGGSMEAEMWLKGSWQAPQGLISLHASGISPPPALAAYLPAESYGLEGRVAFSPGLLDLDLLRLSAPSLTLDLHGQWRGLDIEALRRLDPAALPGELDFSGRLAAPDMAWLGRALPAIRRLGGRLEADLRASGPARQPALAAELRVSDGALRLSSGGLPAMGELAIAARVEPRLVRIHSLAGLLGGSPFRLHGDLDFGEPGGPRFDLALDGDSLLLYRDENLRLRADADLHLRGPLSQLSLEGELKLHDSHYIRNLTLADLTSSSPKNGGDDAGIRLFSLTDPPFSNLRFALGIKTSEPFMVKNNLINGSARADLVLQGSGLLPKLVGVLYVDPTRVSLPSGTLRVASGLFRFPAANPERPELNLDGEARLLGYDVFMQIQGRYDRPVVSLSSSPPLSNEELLLLLLAGVRPEGENNNLSAAGGNIALYLSRELLAQWFPSGNGELGVLFERLEIDVGRAITREGDLTIETRLRLAEALIRDNDTLYLKSEKDVYDHINTGIAIVFRFH